MRTIQFWFEFASIYSYPAALRIEALAREASVKVEYRPFLLGPIFASQGLRDTPVHVFPVKGRYMWRDVERICADYGIPFLRPRIFPQNGLLAARVALVAADEPWGPAFVRAVYAANFAEDRDIADPEVVASILRSLDQDPAAVLARAADPSNKERLRAQNEEALKLGIFGAPSFVVDGELFWGNDRLERALAWRGAP